MLARNATIETDGGPRPRATERLCVVTRTVRTVEELLRFVVGPDGAVVPDLKRKLPGRGFWITATREALGEAVRRQALRRVFRSDVTTPPDLVSVVERLLERSVLDALAIAHKAGQIVNGFVKVEAAIA